MGKHAMPIKLRFASQRFSRSSTLLVALILVILILTAGRFGSRSSKPSVPYGAVPSLIPPPPTESALPVKPFNRLPVAAGQCAPEIEHLRNAKLNLSDDIVYTQRCVKPIRRELDPTKVMNISDPMIMNTTKVDLMSCSHAESIPCVELPLPIPDAYPAKKFGHMTFAVASPYQRINTSLPEFAHWLSGTGAKLVGVVTDAEKEGAHFNLKALEKLYHALDVNATFLAPRLKKPLTGDPELPVPIEQHHFMLIQDAVSVSTPQTEWIGILDDDTFFPSLFPLDRTFQQFDPSQEWWLGALSDDFNQVKHWGYMSFGGAGTFLSSTLAKFLAPLAEQCIRERSVDTGDGILRDCVFRHTRTRLTQVAGLYQMDFRGDASGFFEGGLRPLSLHHWKSWFAEPVAAIASVAAQCGDCFLQRYRFDDDFLLTNGYSVTQYPGGLDQVDLGWLEGTWPHGAHEFDFSYGPLRPRLGPEEKKSWRVKDAYTTGGVFRQVYVHYGDWEAGEKDEVVELVWPS